MVANILYVGSQTYTSDDEGKITNIVHQLIDTCGAVAGQVFVLDSLFTSVELIEIANELEIGIIGTFKFPFKCGPSFFKEEEYKEDIDSLKRGEFRQYVCGNVTITIWKDSKIVKFIDNCVNRDILVDVTRQVGATKKTWKVPLVVQIYNSYKGTVDVSNQHRAVAPIDRKTKRKNCLRIATYEVEEHLLVNCALLAHELDPLKHYDSRPMRDDLYNYWSGQRLDWMRLNGETKVRRHGVENWRDYPQCATVTHLKRFIDPSNHRKTRTCINCSTRTARCCDTCKIANDILPFCKSCWNESKYH